ncbi:PREDICTED: interferon alpha-inducible protein 27-like protein 2 [Capra hircus]|uniref:interferon alpha-inducible protein 27-like protein 2 n=1 Tax=Capra hircus TaxID=9925 RepID=UPI00084719F2|nr:PREDICTED: interferon alpha-inducible protein 27-like protein 2 [Capra hircus]
MVIGVMWQDCCSRDRRRKVSGRSRESVPWDQTQISCLPVALVVAAVPMVLGAMGFTGAGIAASSIAAKMMSAAAVASVGGVAAGSLVATLQSVGAAGLSTSSNILLGSAGSATGAWLWGSKKKAPSPPGSSTQQESGSCAGDDPAGPQDVSPPNDKPSASQNSSKNHKK